jgi:hypothetical protein
MFPRNLPQIAAAGMVAIALTACVDSPAGVSPRVPDAGLVVLDPQYIVPAANLNMREEKVAVCKVFAGSSLGYPTAQFAVDFTGVRNETVTFGLKDGECADLGFYGSTGVDVTVTETAIPGYTTSFTTQQYFFQSAGPVSPSTAGYVATGVAWGSRNGAPAVGTLFVYTNTYVPPSGCTYTQGYWKTHSEHGPAPYDATWALLPNGADTPFYLSGQTYYQVFHTAPAGNAYYNLAHQWMAAHLNTLNGASVPAAVAAAIASGNSLFSTYTPAQVAALPKSSPTRAQFIALAALLDDYNNGLTGPGHCGA